jgi:hypothetical protein
MCAFHKVNVSVRMAIKKHEALTVPLAALSKYAASARRSINQSKIQIEEKSRLRCENKTWCSPPFILLESFKR